MSRSLTHGHLSSGISTGKRDAGDDEFVGSNPPGSTLINYYLKKRHVFGEMHLEIYNDKGEKIKELPAGKRKGLNRVSWQMRMKGPKFLKSPLLSPQAMYGPTYPPGKYTVKIIKGDQTYEGRYQLYMIRPFRIPLPTAISVTKS